jgi:hypothetical protein
MEFLELQFKNRLYKKNDIPIVITDVDRTKSDRC